jgi:hypothetical protein
LHHQGQRECAAAGERDSSAAPLPPESRRIFPYDIVVNTEVSRVAIPFLDGYGQ